MKTVDCLNLNAGTYKEIRSLWCMLSRLSVDSEGITIMDMVQKGAFPSNVLRSLI